MYSSSSQIRIMFRNSWVRLCIQLVDTIISIHNLNFLNIAFDLQSNFLSSHRSQLLMQVPVSINEATSEVASVSRNDIALERAAYFNRLISIVYSYKSNNITWQTSEWHLFIFLEIRLAFFSRLCPNLKELFHCLLFEVVLMFIILYTHWSV